MRKERTVVKSTRILLPTTTFVDVTMIITVVTSRAARRPAGWLADRLTSGSGRWRCGQSAALLRFGSMCRLLLGIWVSMYYVRIYVCVNAYMCILLTVCRSLQTGNAKRPSAYYANTNCYNSCFVSQIRLTFENRFRRELYNRLRLPSY